LEELGPLPGAIFFLMVPDIEDSAHVGVRNFSGELDLTYEPLSCAVVRCNFWENRFQRNVFVESRVVRLIDFTHAAPSNEANNLVTASKYLVRWKPR
jgi:hypothetical protein